MNVRFFTSRTRRATATTRRRASVRLGAGGLLTTLLLALPSPASAQSSILDAGALHCRLGHVTVTAPAIVSTGAVAWRAWFYFYDSAGTYHGEAYSNWIYGDGGSAAFPQGNIPTNSFPGGTVYVWHEVYDYDTNQTSGLFAKEYVSGDTWCRT